MDKERDSFRPRVSQGQGSGNYRGGGWNNNPERSISDYFQEWNYQSEWITKGANEDLVSFAEKTGKFLAKNKLTNSKIRNVYGEIKRIQMGTFEKERSSFYLLRPKMAYALGRDSKNKGLEMFKLIFDTASKDVTDETSYQNFCNLIEAMLAYHKANGGD
ncbi:type III-A CRISPR-associated protein Csm2 [Bacteroides sp. UBA939]|uniref:type III-A CRISPR-associated protein Csm2 n=1 Tax=Bacteroides sp. UBA939 TaxID=1946092 RepID=UPI0025C6C2D2|nr:type III-A CRISPR-associated protein Csm2 [Bacteroides sp. UBA939]